MLDLHLQLAIEDFKAKRAVCWGETHETRGFPSAQIANLERQTDTTALRTARISVGKRALQLLQRKQFEAGGGTRESCSIV